MIQSTRTRTLVWFRGKDLRVADHEPLREAAAGGEVIPVFVIDPHFFSPESSRQHPHRTQFLLESVDALRESLAYLGSELVLVEGRSVDVVPRLAEHWRVDRVVAHRWVEPFARERDARIRGALRMPFDLFEGETLLPPGTLRSQSNRPFSVYSAFARAFRRTFEARPPLPAPRSLAGLPSGVGASRVVMPTLEDLGLTHNDRLLAGGESAARARSRAFLRRPAERYHEGRDRMAEPGTSRLSQDLKFGTLSARTLWWNIQNGIDSDEAREKFESQLIWREFAHSTLWDRPDLLHEPFRRDFRNFPWQDDHEAWAAWTEGRTGYPLVDAAARQLLAEGFVHNRARMIAASFLTKHLLISYQRGEAHYMKYLTDGDWAQNNAGWQWSAGCGCDAQPYFRIFNPARQGARFDPTGEYVRRWVPELAAVPAPYVHAPWLAPRAVLEAASVTLGVDYPEPIVDHTEARQRFLAVAKQHLRSGDAAA